MQKCAFWGLHWYCFQLWGWNPQIPQIFRASITVFKKDGQNIEFFILSKLQHRFQPNFAQRQRSPSSHRGWSQYAPNKSKMANGRHFDKKTVKSPYLCNRLTDFDKMWHGDAHWPRTENQPLKFRIFENARWQRLETHKNRRISSKAWPIFTKTGTVKQNLSLNGSDSWKIWILKIQNGGQPPFWKLLNYHISPTVRLFFMKFGWHSDVKLKF